MTHSPFCGRNALDVDVDDEISPGGVRYKAPLNGATKSGKGPERKRFWLKRRGF